MTLKGSINSKSLDLIPQLGKFQEKSYNDSLRNEKSGYQNEDSLSQIDATQLEFNCIAYVEIDLKKVKEFYRDENSDINTGHAESKFYKEASWEELQIMSNYFEISSGASKDKNAESLDSSNLHNELTNPTESKTSKRENSKDL